MIKVQRQPDDEHIQADAQLCAHVQHVARFLGEDSELQIGKKQPEQRRPKDHAGDHFTDDLRLVQQFLAQPSDHATGENDDGELQEKVDAEVARYIALCGIHRRTVRT